MRRVTLLLAITIAAVALTQTAAAQMMGGGRSGGGMGSGGQGGTGMGPDGGMGMGGAGMDGAGRLLVSGSSTFVVSRAPGTSSGQVMTARLLAIGPNGQKAWTWDAGGPIHDIAAAGDLVIVAVGDPSADGSTQPGAAQGFLVALRMAAGTEAWRLPLEGVSMRLETASDRILTLVAKMTTSADGSRTGGHMGSGNGSAWSMSRSLVAVDLTGRLLWTVALDE